MTDDFPPGWTKTIRELFAEVPRRVLEQRELAWARAYERSELRKWARFPKDGDIFETTHDTPVEYLTHWRAPFTDGGSGVLPAGTRVQVSVYEAEPEPISVYADPLDATRIEQTLVPAAVRAEAKYNGFSLSITTADLNRLYRQVREDVT